MSNAAGSLEADYREGHIPIQPQNTTAGAVPARIPLGYPTFIGFASDSHDLFSDRASREASEGAIGPTIAFDGGAAITGGRECGMRNTSMNMGQRTDNGHVAMGCGAVLSRWRSNPRYPVIP